MKITSSANSEIWPVDQQYHIETTGLHVYYTRVNQKTFASSNLKQYLLTVGLDYESTSEAHF